MRRVGRDAKLGDDGAVVLPERLARTGSQQCQQGVALRILIAHQSAPWRLGARRATVVLDVAANLVSGGAGPAQLPTTIAPSPLSGPVDARVGLASGPSAAPWVTGVDAPEPAYSGRIGSGHARPALFVVGSRVFGADAREGDRAGGRRDRGRPRRPGRGRGEGASARTRGCFPGARRSLAAAIAVRVNALAGAWGEREVVELVRHAGSQIGSLVVPKVERSEDIVEVERLLDSLGEPARGVRLQGLVETAAGLLHVGEIAAASPRLEALILGYADLAASLSRGPGVMAPESWLYAQKTVLVAARAAGSQTIDGPYLEIRDHAGLRLRVEHGPRARVRWQMGGAPRPADDHQRGVHSHGRRARSGARDPRRAQMRRGTRRGRSARRDDRSGGHADVATTSLGEQERRRARRLHVPSRGRDSEASGSLTAAWCTRPSCPARERGFAVGAVVGARVSGRSSRPRMLFALVKRRSGLSARSHPIGLRAPVDC